MHDILASLPVDSMGLNLRDLSALSRSTRENHEDPLSGAARSQDEAPQAVFQSDRVEVHQQTDLDITNSEVSQQLDVVCRR
jgi:hypothetical protein